MSCDCQGCGKQYKIDLLIPDELWVKISPKRVEGSKGGGLLCGSCIMESLERISDCDFFYLSKRNIFKDEPLREHLPDTRAGVTSKAAICQFKFYTTVNFYDDGRPSEVFLTIAKRGSTVSGFARTLAVIISVALQSGVPWPVLYGKLEGMRFEPRDDEYSSLIDAMAKSINKCIELVKGGEDNGKNCRSEIGIGQEV